MIVTSFQDLKFLGKQIPLTFSYFLIKQCTFVPFFGEFINSQSENDLVRPFSRGFVNSFQASQLLREISNISHLKSRIEK